MTLIVGVLTEKHGYLVGDKMRSMDTQNGEPICLNMVTDSGAKINIQAPHIRLNTTNFCKLRKISDNVIIGGAGDMSAFEAYLNFISNKDNYIEETRNYYMENLPAIQLFILYKKGNKYCIDYFGIDNSNSELEYFVYHHYTVRDGKLGIISIGCGSGIFFSMLSRIKDKELEKYTSAIASNQYDEWEQTFMQKISKMYADISRYDDAVGNEIDIFSIE